MGEPPELQTPPWSLSPRCRLLPPPLTKNRHAMPLAASSGGASGTHRAYVSGSALVRLEVANPLSLCGKTPLCPAVALASRKFTWYGPHWSFFCLEGSGLPCPVRASEGNGMLARKASCFLTQSGSYLTQPPGEVRPLSSAYETLTGGVCPPGPPSILLPQVLRLEKTPLKEGFIPHQVQGAAWWERGWAPAPW